ncbi:flavin reductase family protein [Roseibium algae]|uniref:Flavin reductase family protein n=1 Tax=Roseibium algae TaxID=3123038 RepID=A0ABU8TMI9_9HYPH
MTDMFLDFDELDGRSRYKLLTATVVPRPIALVSTVSANGVVNAAPFSFFNIFSEDPALAILGLEARRDTNGMKDTTRNIIDTGELVINLVDQKMGDAMAACAADLPKDISELPFAGLTEAPSKRVTPPGIAESPIRLECRLFEMRKITSSRHLCIAEILALHSRDGLIDPENLHVDTSAYTPIGRLHGEHYVAVEHSFEIPVPHLPQTIAGTSGSPKEETGS